MNSNMNANSTIDSFSITKNENSNFFTVKIETETGSITYDNALVQFLVGDLISFPYSIKVFNKNGDAVYDWDLTRKPEKLSTDTEEKAENKGEE